MRSTRWLAFLFCCTTALAQSGLWSRVGTEPSNRHLESATLSKSQTDALAGLLRTQKPDSTWDCEGADLEEMIQGLIFKAIPLSAGNSLVLAEAPAGCARGGQGANGAMWIIRFDGNKPVLLASPANFGGWIYAILPASNGGYPDIVLGWHMGAGEASLSYFRFNGKTYSLAGTATWISDEDGNVKIVPAPK
jgi:hypothetical protein